MAAWGCAEPTLPVLAARQARRRLGLPFTTTWFCIFSWCTWSSCSLRPPASIFSVQSFGLGGTFSCGFLRMGPRRSLFGEGLPYLHVFIRIPRDGWCAWAMVVSTRNTESRAPSPFSRQCYSWRICCLSGQQTAVCDSRPWIFQKFCSSCRDLEFHDLLRCWALVGPLTLTLVSLGLKIFLYYFFHNSFCSLFLNLLVPSKTTSVFMIFTSGSLRGVSQQKGERVLFSLSS